MSRDRKALKDDGIQPHGSENLVCIGSKIKVLVLKGIGHIYGAIGLAEKGHPAI